MGEREEVAREPWRVPDRRFRSGYRWTPRGRRMIRLWGGLIIAWPVIAVLNPTLGGWWIFGIIVYAIGRIAMAWRKRFSASATAAPPMPAAGPPAAWPHVDQAGWQPGSSWPAASDGWQPWTPAAAPDAQAPVGQRNTRNIPQDVKIAVAARDQGRCRQCGSTKDLHFDHVIPWSRSGTNTVQNIQLLCGPCNRRKGADDIPVVL